MHRLLTPETTTFTLMRGLAIGSRYDRQPDGSCLITAVNFKNGTPTDVITERSTLTFDEVLAEIANDDDVVAVR